MHFKIRYTRSCTAGVPDLETAYLKINGTQAVRNGTQVRARYGCGTSVVSTTTVPLYRLALREAGRRYGGRCTPSKPRKTLGLSPVTT